MNTMNTASAEATIGSISTTKDGGLRFSVVTQELTPAMKVAFMEYHGQFGYFAFRPNAFQEDDIPKTDVEDKQKTPGKRLRSVLFLLFKSLNKGKNFQAWYMEEMEKIIDHYKSKLDL